MQWVLWMIAVGVLGLAAVAASGRLGELPGTVTDTPRPHVPTGDLAGDDLRGLRFAVVPRGYSMDQVDELLDRLARQLDRDRTPGLDPASRWLTARSTAPGRTIRRGGPLRRPPRRRARPTNRPIRSHRARTGVPGTGHSRLE